MNFDISALFSYPFIVFWLIGLGVTYFLGEKYVQPSIDKLVLEVTKKVNKFASKDEIEDWNLVTDFDFPGGEKIGRIERFVLYFGILFGNGILIGAWLTFKVAVKWESWSNIVKVPMKDDKGDPDAFGFVLRRYWGTLVYQRFLVGTGLNLLYAGLGVFIGNVLFWILQTIKPIP